MKDGIPGSQIMPEARLAQSGEWSKHLEANNRTPAFLNHADSQKARQLLYEELRTLITELGLARP